MSRTRGAGEVGRFESPHSPQDTLQVVYAGLASQLSTEEFRATAPGPMATIFISRLSPGGITVTAGNSVETYFAFHVDLTPTANGCAGHAYYDRPEQQIRRWTGNAIKINGGVLMALERASVRTTGWHLG
ncbi:hypothetical protein [Kitasatospora sp. LaBMicrA B282]|uniref:hypothetical protein n=1 Tax=Kitasatospora sp. LaBMicrA B282 TaxID=3420949 RepID=UPI003D110BB3